MCKQTSKGYNEKGQFPSLESESNYIRKYTNLETAQWYL